MELTIQLNTGMEHSNKNNILEIGIWKINDLNPESQILRFPNLTRETYLKPHCLGGWGRLHLKPHWSRGLGATAS